VQAVPGVGVMHVGGPSVHWWLPAGRGHVKALVMGSSSSLLESSR
jgi:hypothetical protein